MKKRPIGVTILAVLAALAAIVAGFRVLQFLGLFPFWFGPVPFRNFSLICRPNVGFPGLYLHLAGENALGCQSPGLVVLGSHLRVQPNLGIYDPGRRCSLGRCSCFICAQRIDFDLCVAAQHQESLWD